MRTLLLLLVASVAWGQQQLFCKAVPGHPVVAIAVPAPGSGTTAVKTGMTCIPIDLSAFFVDVSTNPPTLRIVLPPPTIFVDDEVPTGAVDGTNAVFQCETSAPQGLEVFRNGIRENVGEDYTLAGGTITFLPGAIPSVRDILKVKYRR